MKIGLFWDMAIDIDSYYVKNGQAFSFKTNQPYMYHHSISSYCFPSTHNYPFLWGDGCFINISEWNELPDYELDLIFYGNMRAGLDDATKSRYSVERIRKKYPNAKIIGYTKEVHVKPEREQNRIEFFKECDFIQAETCADISINPRPKIVIPEYLHLEDLVGKELKFVNQPINIDYLFDNLYTNEKEFSIFAYMPNPQYRRGRTYDFATYIGKKYSVPVVYKTQLPTNNNGTLVDMSFIDFIKWFSSYLFHFNLDPSPIHPGGQCCYIANLGSINIGGNNESHEVLYPGLSGLDEKALEQKFSELYEDSNLRIQTIEYAWEKLNKLYSFNNVKNQIINLYTK